MTRIVNETPDMLPLRFETNLRQSSVAVPENLLVIAILQKYHQTVQGVLSNDLEDEMLNEQERQQLTEVEEHIERELAAPHARALYKDARNADIEQLIEQVQTRLPAGTNPYRNLIEWWEQFSALHIGTGLGFRKLTLAHKHTDDDTNAYLYELWIALELIHMLYNLHIVAATDIEIRNSWLRFTFTWNKRRFHFTYYRQLGLGEEMTFGWQNVPATHPCYTVEREQTLKVSPNDVLIWREPPVILDAYYSSTLSFSSSSVAIQKLLGEMRLQGAHHGVLFQPAQPDLFTGQQYSVKVKRDSNVYTEGMGGDTDEPYILLYKLVPDSSLEALQARLRGFLDELTSQEMLPERPAPACHGIMLDEDSINASHSHPTGYNVLCPKPHIGKGIFDLVNDKIHCLKDPRLCHIFGQAKMPPFVIRAVTSDALNQQSRDIRTRADETLRQAEQSGNEDTTEQLRSHIFLSVGRTVEQYVKLRGNTTTLESYFEEWIFGDYWKNHPRCLSEETRNILLSGAYVWDEHKQTTLDDWAAPAIQFCRALETEIKRRLHNYYPDQKSGFNVPYGNMTLGSFETIYNLKAKDPNKAKDGNEANRIKIAQHNWGLCHTIVVQSKSDIRAFEAILKRMVEENVAKNRNTLAHSGLIPQSTAQDLRDVIIGRKDKPGILCWLAEHLEPKK
jgi:hypothetical protein